MKKVRFGLIGFGAWGQHHARAIAECPNAELAAIAVRSPAAQAEARRLHPAAEVFGNYRQLLARSDVEAADVVLPTDLHFAVAADALRAGKHLLLEKPMALTLAECDELIRLARQEGRLLAIGHEFRLSSLWGKVKELIAAGAIGEPQYALIELWRNPYRQGADGWRYNIQRVGNWILEEPIHFFDLARWYFSGLGNPVSIYARANARRPDHPELQDNFSAIVNFARGAYAVISQTLSAFEHHQVAKVTGTRGALWASWSGAMDRTFHPTFSLKHFDGEKHADIAIPKATGEVYELAEEIAMLAGAVRENKPLAATGEDGMWSVRLCLKAQESVERGCVVPL
ncbi:MAG TPA: Gfo/Idh/MocA family oxidoreductase [Candidatus Binatia bacterium]|jgi:myo-inositol 2-dehydrogenase/D-chiro-inositol 1-dehydrogenase|nr:Gfo/Idh/MocA family oxidoreductase [Candidatus Binatia bacterium]